jgi:hypothetical protein
MFLYCSRLHPAHERLYHGGLRRDRPEGPSAVHQQHADQGRGGGRKNGNARVQSSEPRRQDGETIFHLFHLSRRIDFLLVQKNDISPKK